MLFTVSVGHGSSNSSNDDEIIEKNPMTGHRFIYGATHFCYIHELIHVPGLSDALLKILL